jgi:hypothetical protein
VEGRGIMSPFGLGKSNIEKMKAKDESTKLLALSRAQGKRIVTIVFKLEVPEESENVYIAGTFNNWDPKGNRLTRVQQTSVWTFSLDFLEGEVIEYKYTMGTWETVEMVGVGAFQVDVPNRRIVTKPDRPGVSLMSITDFIDEWKRKTSQGETSSYHMEVNDGDFVTCTSCKRKAPVKIFDKKQVTLIGPEAMKSFTRQNIALKCQDCGVFLCFECSSSKIRGAGIPKCPECGKEGGPYFIVK